MTNFKCKYIKYFSFSRPKEYSYDTARSTLYLDLPSPTIEYELPSEVARVQVYCKNTKKWEYSWFFLVTYKDGDVLCYDEDAIRADSSLPLRYSYGGLKNGEWGVGGPGWKDAWGFTRSGNKHIPADFDPALFKAIPGIHLTAEGLYAINQAETEAREKAKKPCEKPRLTN